MNKYKYYIAYDDNKLIRANDAETPDMFILERYDQNKNTWIDDSDMCGIYSGDIPVRCITEEEAKMVISKYN